MYLNNDTFEFLTKTFAAESITYNAEFKGSLKPGAFHSPLGVTGFRGRDRGADEKRSTIVSRR